MHYIKEISIASFLEKVTGGYAKKPNNDDYIIVLMTQIVPRMRKKLDFCA